jgi:type I restriction enzyme S subunit
MHLEKRWSNDFTMTECQSLADVCELLTDGTHYTPPAVETGVPYLTVKDMTASGLDFANAAKVSREEYEKARSGNCTPLPGDVLFSKDGTVGKVQVVREQREFVVLSSIAILRPRTDVVLPEYLGFALRNPVLLEKALGRRSGTALRRIILKDLKSIQIPVPSLSEQARSVDIMSRADGIVRMRRVAEAKAKEIIPALFVDGFSEYRESNGGRREADPVERLGDVAEVVSGVAKGRKLVGKTTREVPYLRVANVQAGVLDLSEMKYIPATEGEIKELAVRAGDVLLTEGGDFDKVGRGALLETELGECIHQNHVFRVRAHPDKLVPEYLASFLQTFAARQYFLKAAKKTSNLASINMTQLKNLPLPVPHLDRQVEFQAKFRMCRSLEGQQARASSIAAVSFQSLLAGVFGEGA